MDVATAKALLAIEEAILATIPRSPWGEQSLIFKVQDDRVCRLRVLVEARED